MKKWPFYGFNKDEVLSTKKQIFSIEIIETLLKTVIIEANDAEQALSKVQEMYKNEQVILDSDNYLDTEFLIKDAKDN